jgi:cytochrome P450
VTSTDATPQVVPMRLEDLVAWCRTSREGAPVVPSEMPGVWNVFSYQAAQTILSDPATFSSDLSHLVTIDDEDIKTLAKGMFISLDPPVHDRLRTLASKAFTPRFVANLEPRISLVCNELLDAVDGGSAIELVEKLSYPLPVIVISELLGLPEETRGQFFHWTEAILSMNGQERTLPTENEVAEFGPLAREMNAFMLDQIAQRRANPRDDLITRLIEVDEGGQKLADEEIVGFVALLLVAGHVTTTALLGNTLVSLYETPGSFAEVRSDRTLLPGAIEEALRTRPPVVRVPRIATRAVEVAGVPLDAGTVLTVWLVGANRDPQAFADPDRYDLRRTPNRHLGFGRGIHHCLGAPLSRLESRIALNLIMDRYRDIAVDLDEVGYYHPMSMIGVKKLPLRVVPA